FRRVLFRSRQFDGLDLFLVSEVCGHQKENHQQKHHIDQRRDIEACARLPFAAGDFHDPPSRSLTTGGTDGRAGRRAGLAAGASVFFCGPAVDRLYGERIASAFSAISATISSMRLRNRKNDASAGTATHSPSSVVTSAREIPGANSATCGLAFCENSLKSRI